MFKRGIDRWNTIWCVGLRPGSIPAMLFALVCVAVATLMRISLGLVSPDSTIFAPYYSATLVAALVSGAAAGFLAAMRIQYHSVDFSRTRSHYDDLTGGRHWR